MKLNVISENGRPTGLQYADDGRFDENDLEFEINSDVDYFLLYVGFTDEKTLQPEVYYASLHRSRENAAIYAQLERDRFGDEEFDFIRVCNVRLDNGVWDF